MKATYITVPEDVSINDTYTKASEYNVPVTVVAKDETGKKSRENPFCWWFLQ